MPVPTRTDKVGALLLLTLPAALFWLCGLL
jgi:hypothetical protein